MSESLQGRRTTSNANTWVASSYYIQQDKETCFKQILERIICRCSSDVPRQTVPRSRTSDGECPVAELAPGAWNEEVNTGCRAESTARSDGRDWHTQFLYIIYKGTMTVQVHSSPCEPSSSSNHNRLLLFYLLFNGGGQIPNQIPMSKSQIFGCKIPNPRYQIPIPNLQNPNHSKSLSSKSQIFDKSLKLLTIR